MFQKLNYFFVIHHNITFERTQTTSYASYTSQERVISSEQMFAKYCFFFCFALFQLVLGFGRCYNSITDDVYLSLPVPQFLPRKLRSISFPQLPELRYSKYKHHFLSMSRESSVCSKRWREEWMAGTGYPLLFVRNAFY